jgi:hypothetical protein
MEQRRGGAPADRRWQKMRKPVCALLQVLSLLCFAPEANAAKPGHAPLHGAVTPAIRVWPMGRLGKAFFDAYFASEREGPVIPRALTARIRAPDAAVSRALVPRLFYPPGLDVESPSRGPAALNRLGFVFRKIGVREQMDGVSPLDRYSAADRYSAVTAPSGTVFVIEMGRDASVVAYGKRYGETGGEGKLRLGKLVEAWGSALFRRDGGVSIAHDLDLRLMQIALNAPGVSVSPFARAGFLLDIYPDGERRATLMPGAGLDFVVPFGVTYPLRLEVTASPELTIDIGRGPSRLGARLMVGAEILMF